MRSLSRAGIALSTILLVAATGHAATTPPTATPPTLAFSATSVGAGPTELPVHVANPIGGSAVTFAADSATVSGAGASAFSITADSCSSTTLAPATGCDITVRHDGTVACALPATLTIASDAGTVSVPITAPTTPPSSTSVGSLVVYCTTPSAEPRSIAAGPDGRVWFAESGSPWAPRTIASLDETGLLAERRDLPGGYSPSFLTLGADGALWFMSWDSNVRAGMVRFAPPSTYERRNLPDATLVATAPNVVPGTSGGVWYADSYGSCGGSPLLFRVMPGGVVTSTTPSVDWLRATAANPASSSLGTTPCVNVGSLAQAPDGTMWGTSSGLGRQGSATGLLHVGSDGRYLGFVPTTKTPAGIAIDDAGLLWVTTGNSSTCQLEVHDAFGGYLDAVLPTASLYPFACARPTIGPDHHIWLPGVDATSFTPKEMYRITDPATVDAFPVPGSFGLMTEEAAAAAPDEGIYALGLHQDVLRVDPGAGTARAFVNPRVLGFSFAGAATPTGTFTVRSTGTVPLHVTAVELVGDMASSFRIGDETCTQAAVAPGASCSIRVFVQPGALVSDHATLQIASDDAFSPQLAFVTADRTPPQPPTLTPAPVSFPSQAVGTRSGTTVVRVHNPGATALMMAPGAGISGADAAEFQVVQSTCARVLAPGATCRVSVVFVPTSPGAKQARLDVTTDAEPRQASAALTGIAGAQPSSCGCSLDGRFVDPRLVALTTGDASPGGSYALTVTPATADTGIPGAPGSFDITGPTSTIHITAPTYASWPYNDTSWGFSPDDDRFILHYRDQTGIDTVAVYNLAGATPTIATATLTYLGATTAVAFDPSGHYLMVLQVPGDVNQPMHVNVLDATSPAPLSAPRINDEILISLPPLPNPSAGKPLDLRTAGFGFAPNATAFAIQWVDRNGSTEIRTYSTTTGHPTWSTSTTGYVAAYLQFGPCGDVLALVEQHPSNFASPVHITLIETSTGTIKSSHDSLPFGNIAIEAVNARWIVRILPASGVEQAITLGTVTGCVPATPTSATSSTASTPVGGAGSTLGPCACPTAGRFVDPRLVALTTGDASPGGSYALIVTPATADTGIPGAPGSFDITGPTSTIHITAPTYASWPYNDTSWGFSPDDDRFILHYRDQTGIDTVAVYNLAGATPTIATATLTYLGATTAVAFDPSGHYLMVLQVPGDVNQPMHVNVLDATSPAPLSAPRINDEILISLPPLPNPSAGKPLDLRTAGFGFAPNATAFAIQWVDRNGSTEIRTYSTTTGHPTWSTSTTGYVAAYLQFGPCGDVLALVEQHPSNFASPVHITLIETSTGTIKSSHDSLPFGNIAISSTGSAWQADILTSDGTNVTTVTTALGAIPGCVAPHPARPRARIRTTAGPSTAPYRGLVLPFGRGELDVPDDAASPNAVVTYTALDTAPPPPAGRTVIGGAFRIEATEALSAPLVLHVGASATAVTVLRRSGSSWVALVECATCDAPPGAVSVLVDVPGDMIVVAQASANVPVLSLQPAWVRVGSDSRFTGVVAVARASAAPADAYTAAVDWGDGAVTPALVAASGGLLQVVGAHTYAVRATYRVRATIQGGLLSSSATSTAAWTPAPHLTVAVAGGKARAGSSLKERITVRETAGSAVSATVRITLPVAGATYQRASAPGWTCRRSLLVVTCTTARLAARAAATITVRVRVTAKRGRKLAFTARASTPYYGAAARPTAGTVVVTR